MKLFQIDEGDASAELVSVVSESTCPANPGFNDAQTRVFQLTVARRDWALTENSLVFSGTSPFGTFEPYSSWNNWYDAVGGIYKIGHPRQPRIPAGGIQLAFDYSISLSLINVTEPTSGSVSLRTFVDIFGGVIDGGDFVGGTGGDMWEIDDTFTVNNTYSDSGSAVITIAAGSVGFVMLEVWADIDFAESGAGSSELSYNISLTNFEWICA